MNEPSVRERLVGVDMVRGAVMVLMAIDHVRVYAGLPAGGPTPGIFFTRWVTHFCAPAFVFLAGTGAFFHGRKLGDLGRLSRFLAIRGLWLVILELTFLRFAWTFNFDYGTFTMAGVIWAIGWCMVLLAILVRLPLPAVGAIGLVIVAGHNVMDLLPSGGDAESGPWTWLAQVLYFGGPISLSGDGPVFFVLYAIVPWVGVIACGYAFGAVLALEPARRRRLCFGIGLGATALFVALRGLHTYGNPFQGGPRFEALPPFLAFLETTKYPASLQFLLMTLGPTIALLPLLDHARGKIAEWLTVFGRVPLFYYLLHIPLIHAVAVLISLVRTPAATGWLIGNHPIWIPPAPEGYVWSLPLLYLVTAGVVTALYFPCRWFAAVKRRRPGTWLSFL